MPKGRTKYVEGRVPPRPRPGWNRALHSICCGLVVSIALLSVSCGFDDSQEKTAKLTDEIWAELYSEQESSIEKIESLLIAGADPNLKTVANNDYLLEWAAEKMDDELMLLLLNYGANPNLHEEATSPLHWACSLSGWNCLLVVDALVSNGSDVNARDEVGSTPLHWAARGRSDCAAYLLHNGANIEIRNHAGQTALDVAKKHSDIYGVDPRYNVTIHRMMWGISQRL